MNKYDGLSVRKATHEDVNDILSIIQGRCKWLDEKQIEQWNTTRTYQEDYYKQKIDDDKFYVGVYQDKVVGTFMMQKSTHYADEEDNIIYIHHLAADKNYPGIGFEMFSEIKKLARSNNVHTIRLDSIATNEKLSGYYERLGFKKIGEIKAEHYDGKNPGNIVELRIDEE